LAGEILYSQPALAVTIDRIKAIIPDFIGQIEQIPPMYSAIQVDGKRLYKLARAGEVIDVPSRIVQIDAIEILNWTPGDFPEVELQITCGGGTYIRSIARDLGEKLGTKGVLAFLERNASCGLQLADSITLAELENQRQAGIFTPIPAERGLAHLPTATLVTEELVKFWGQGKRLPVADLDLVNIETIGNVKVMGENRCLGVGEIRSIDGALMLVPQTVLL
jgi:tRNA pseudouridine55 synthase